MYRLLSFLLLLVFPFFIYSQSQKKDSSGKITFEILSATSTNSRRFFNFNENDHFYFEFRVGYRINKIFETNLFAGYKLKNYI